MYVAWFQIYISKPCVKYRTIQRSENIQRPDLVICEFGDLCHLNHHLGVLSYKSYALLKIKVVLR